MRRVLVLLHRWIGLGLAVFLFLAGITGTIIAWEREVDHFLNPQIFKAESGKDPTARRKSVFELAALVEKQDPRLRVNYLPLSYSPGNTAIMYVEPTKNPATGKDYDLGFNEIFVDPVTAKIQGQREWGELSLRRECWLPLIYRFHYSLKLPGEWGIWLMGILAIVWTLDCFVALAISFPKLKVWRKSFAFRFRQGTWPLVFDLHRSVGVWTWPLLLVIAFTSIWMNLAEQLVKPCVELITSVRQSVFDKPSRYTEPVEPAIGRAKIVRMALFEAQRKKIFDPPGAMAYSPMYGIYSIGFFEANEDHAGHGSFGWQPAWFALDAKTGELLGANIPGRGSWGDRFLDLQFPLHTGRIIGTPGKAIVSLLGVVVSLISATGIVLWVMRQFKRRKPRPERRESSEIKAPLDSPASLATR